MRISTEWLQEYVDLPAPDKLAHLFEMAGAGVEDRTADEDGEIFTLEITSNRGDWLSAFGLAREVAAMTGTRLHLPTAADEAAEDETADSIAGRVQVEIENPQDCPRYVARLIENIKVGPSPEWMQKRLLACGMRPVNNVVDVTNYVMLETGQPLHAFDADKVPDGHIIVRRARAGETITTLDEQERKLDENTLVIADQSTPIAVAGVMGGGDSEVTENTTRILLESAHFSPQRVRHGARALSLQTEASRRFARWVDPNGVLRAANRAAKLLAEHAGGVVASGAIDRYVSPVHDAKVSMRSKRCNALLGLNLTKARMTTLLEQLGLKVSENGETLEVKIPTWRRDIEREADLIEEVARVNGYENIPTTLPRGAQAGAGRSLSQRLEDKARSVLLRCGLTEVVTYSLQNEAAVQRAGLPAELGGAPVRLRNPLSDDYTQLRTSMIPSMLEVLGHNNDQPARVFELGKAYLAHPKPNMQPQERRRIGLAALDAPAPPHWQQSGESADFFTMKGYVARLLHELGAPPAHYRAVQNMPFHPGRCAALCINGEDLGVLGEVHPEVRERYNLNHRAVLAVIDFDALVRHLGLIRKYEPLPRFPASDRDLALVLDETVSAATIETTITHAAGPLLESQHIFDIYRGEHIPQGRKSLAIALRFRASDRTLVDAEVDAAMEDILAAAQNEFGAELRS